MNCLLIRAREGCLCLTVDRGKKKSSPEGEVVMSINQFWNYGLWQWAPSLPSHFIYIVMASAFAQLLQQAIQVRLELDCRHERLQFGY